MKHIKYIFSVVLILILFASCTRTRHDKSKQYMPDMRDSRAYETYSENPNYADNKTARKPVEGTIPRGIIPYQYENTPEGKLAAGKELKNPIELNDKVIKEGEILYQRFCIDCHGVNGDGKGFLFTSGKYPVQPRTLIDDELKNRPAGEIYHVITLGSAVMGAHGSQIASEDRWKIIHYVQEVIQK